MASGSKLIYKERLDFDEKDSTRLSYDVVFRQPEIEREQQEAEEEANREELQQALEEQEQQWQQRLEQVRQQAQQEGYERGLQEGQQQAHQMVQERLTVFEQALDQAGNKVEAVVEQLAPGVTSMIFEVAEKVIGIPLNHSQLRERVRREVRATLDRLDESLRIQVYVSPNDFESIQQITNQYQNRNIHVQADDTLQPGEYFVETNQEAVVRNFQKALRDMRDDLRVEDWRELTDDDDGNEN
jgi:flagellar biosynthesis/type III secretory pathway protein FliH